MKNPTEGVVMENCLPLPDDILFEILTYLPVKSLVRFKSVNKSWNSLISDSTFVKAHLRQRSAMRKSKMYDGSDEKAVVLDSDQAPSSITIFSFNGRFCRFFHQELDIEWKSYSVMGVYGSCNGMLLFRNSYKICCIWNPSTKEHKFLSLPCIVDDSTSTTVLSGLCYDSAMEQYKFVHACQFFNHPSECDSIIFVCTLNGESEEWRVIKQRFTDAKINEPDRVTVVGGTPYWISEYLHDVNHKLILYFDVAEERFAELEQPDYRIRPNRHNRDFFIHLFARGESLCLAYNLIGDHIEFWELMAENNEGAPIWKNTLMIDISARQFRPFFFNGSSLLVERDSHTGFSRRDHGDTFWSVINFDCCHWEPQVGAYVESLVSPSTLISTNEQVTSGLKKFDH